MNTKMAVHGLNAGDGWAEESRRQFGELLGVAGGLEHPAWRGGASCGRSRSRSVSTRSTSLAVSSALETSVTLSPIAN